MSPTTPIAVFIRRAALSPGGAAALLCVPAFFGTLCQFAAPWAPLADVATAAMPLYAVCGVAGTIVALASRRWRRVVPAILVTLWPCAAVAPYLPAQRMEAGEFALTVLSVNLRGDGTDFTWAARLAGEHGADILFFQEYVPQAQAQLAPWLADFPNRHVHVKEGVLGTAIYSRYPLENLDTKWLAPNTYATLFATVAVNGRSIRLVNVHVPPPTRAVYYETRNAALRTLPAELAGIPDVIAAGDLNITPWSPVYRALIARAGFDDARLGQGLHGTWPQAAGLLAFPIDHLLTRGGLECVRFRTLPTDSDHQAVLAEIAVAAVPQ